MNKYLSLMKAITTEDMDLFKVKTKQNSKKSTKIILFLSLSTIFLFALGEYYYTLAKALKEVNLTYIMLCLSLLIPTVFTLIQGIYKSQGILFESTDNSLLLSLPINKKIIIFSRLTKMYLFQLIYNLLFILPAYIIYIYFETPNISFYLISIIMTLLLPIIPTIIACFFGYLVKRFSSIFKTRKLMQTIFTFLIFFGIYYLSLNTNTWIENIIKNASSINEMISKIYYPIGAYINLINDFDILTLIKLLLINIIPLVLFIYILSISYFKIISKYTEHSINKHHKKIKYKTISSFKALVLKDIKRYFSSPIYIFNTFFGLILLLIATIAMCTNFEGLMTTMLNGISKEEISNLYNLVPKVYYALLIILISMTSITSSSISIEGRSFNISKSLPIDNYKKLLSKIVFSNTIIMPIIFICDLIFIIYFKINLFDTITIILISIIMPTLTALIGLLINLAFPKMKATSDTEVIKQSMSVTISILLGLVLSIILIGLLFINELNFIKISINNIIIIELVLLILLTIILFYILKKHGTKKYLLIEV